MSLFHKHKWEIVGFTICSNGLLAPKGYCINVYKCSKCNKLKNGEIRQLTKEEKTSLAENYKKYLAEKV